jgi:hypothetical protein
MVQRAPATTRINDDQDLMEETMASTVRWLIAGVAAAVTSGLAMGPAIAASDSVQLQWEQLIPQDGSAVGSSGPVVPRGVVQHGELMPAPEEFGGLVHDYNGERVRLAGFVVPLDFSETVIQEFLLVPYIGACIHVPPPPLNQIVYVTSDEGVEVAGMFDAVWVTGTFNTAAISNELADIGYRIEAKSVESYE